MATWAVTKKVLFATTALVATASVAAADVTWSGYGRFGLQYQENRSTNPNVSDTRLESRLRLQMDATTETDGGVIFRARFRAEANENADGTANRPASVDSGGNTIILPGGNTSVPSGGAVFNGARFAAEYEGFEMQVGNISDAIDDLPNFYGYEPGLIGAVGQYGNYAGPNNGYSSGGAGSNGVRFRYNVADFQILAAYDQDNDGASSGAGSSAVGQDTENSSIHVAYTFSDWTVALGYADSSDDGGANDSDGVVLTVGGTLGIVDLAFFLAQDDSIPGDNTSYGVSGAVEVGAATTIQASISDGDVGDTSWGIGVVHDLGGGVALKGMIGQEAGNGNNVADLGVQFNF